MENFQSLGLPEGLLQSLQFMQYTTPTPIQAQTIPSALQGLDVLGTAQTGTGKTAAYGIPLISYLMNSEEGAALVLTPTRELALQVVKLLEQMLGRKSAIRSALLIGGDSMTKQLSQLNLKPRLIVGTPGRINDHLARGTLKLDTTGFLVLDETDRMLDMGFGIQLDEINKFLPYKRQTLMFSATLPSNIQNLSAKYLKNAVRVAIGSTTVAADKIKQEIVRTTEGEKYGILLEHLDKVTGSIIVFVKTKMDTEKLAGKLRDIGHEANAIHGDLRQRNRESVIRGFRNKRHRILVATDIAARGLDISHIECVVNYDLPQCPEDYIHRIGRTGRAGAEGLAISLITSQDHLKWRDIHRMMNPGEKLDPSFDMPRMNSRHGSNRRPGSNSYVKVETRNSDNKWGFKSKSPSAFGESTNRNSRPEGAKPWENRAPRTDRPEGAKPWESRAPRGDRPEGAKPWENRAPRGDRPEGAKPWESRAPRGDRPEGAKPWENRAPRGDRPEGAKPWESRSPRGDRSEGAKPWESRSPRGEGAKPWESRSPRGDRPEGAKPWESRSPRGDGGAKPWENRSSSARPGSSSRPSSRPAGGSRPGFAVQAKKRP